jgi:hypothetical protein
MPTLPLLTEAKVPNGTHRVAAPGGYEGWHYTASSDDGQLHVVAGMHESWALDPTYLKRYAWYRRMPTRVRPPVPMDYPAVTFALFQAEQETVRFTVRARPDEVRATDDGRSIRIGASHVDRSFDEVIHLHLRGMEGARTIAVDMTFHPIIRVGREISLDPPAEQHRWVVVDPFCEVDGSISVFDAGAQARVIPFAGTGCHDHFYGTRSLAEGGERTFYGRVLLGGRALAFEQLGETSEAHLMRASKGIDPELTRAAVEGRPGDPELRIGPLYLTHPTILVSNRSETLMTYHAAVADDHGIALCRVQHRRRVGWFRR